MDGLAGGGIGAGIAAGLIVLARYGAPLVRGRNNNTKNRIEKLEQQVGDTIDSNVCKVQRAAIEIRIACLETVLSERIENLGTLMESSRREIVGLIAKRQNDLTWKEEHHEPKS